ncbi:helix-turn-helix domain-containing protein [Methylobacterium sp. ARG-1]|uniref:helix-turn-helix domain-containing protein n=1 Tax=Methylobacterium sp. ARG-1 TaxID=1692501 RepID=UPI0009E9269D|nr:helix-turn-helix domain-containing protein [Methylobacterium sp. ARG-1]
MFAEEIRRQAEIAPQAALPAVTAALWRAYGEGKVTEIEAETLSGLIAARTISTSRRRENPPTGQVMHSPVPGVSTNVGNAGIASGNVGSPSKAIGSRPRTDASLERRRRWAASGRLPPGLAARFTLAEQAVLALVAAETVRRKDCRLAVGHIAAIVGVAETTVRNAIREAVRLELVTVEERRITGFRNDTNIVRIISPEWQAWLRLARKSSAGPGGLADVRRDPAKGGGCKSAQRTSTQVLDSGISETTAPSKCCRRAAGDLDRSDRPGIRAGRRTSAAMR